MRLLPKHQQDTILSASCDFLRLHSHFKLDGSSLLGPCGSSIRTISGEEEGLFGWIAVNYLMDGFGHKDESATYGFLDMGGASTQIAFEPSVIERERHADNLTPIRLRLLGGNEVHHEVFVTTWLGYGTNRARERYVGKVVSEYEKDRPSQIDGEHELVPDPCLPVGLTLTENPAHTDPSTSHSKKPHTLLGTGSFEQCLKRTESLLNKDKPCPDAPCLFDGVHVPPIDFSASHFIGVSEYWYSSEQIFGLGGPYDVVQYERAASDFCSRSWKDLVLEHQLSQKEHHSGNNSSSSGNFTGPELSRLEMQCFKAAWIANVLHEGIGLPRIVDPGGNEPGEGGELIEEMAQKKGLGRPRFQSLDTIKGTAISWALGKMVLEASNEVSPALPHSPPLKDPLKDPSKDPLDTTPPTESTNIPPPNAPTLDLDKLEDQLPSSLSRHTLSFSPFALLFYVALFIIIMFIVYRLRYRVRSVIRRFGRGSLKREKVDVVFDAYSIEEAKIGGGSSRPSTPSSSSPPSPTGTGPSTAAIFNGVSHKLRRVFSSHSLGRPSTSSAHKSTSHRYAYASTTPVVPSFSQSGAASRSGSSTPVNGVDESYVPAANGLAHSFKQSRSRNSSQMNLTTLVPRTVPHLRPVH